MHEPRLRFRFHRSAIAGASCLALVLVAGGVADAKELTRAQFAKAADGICTKLQAESLKKAESAGLLVAVREGSAESKEHEKKLAPIVVAHLTKSADQIAKLEAPKADKAKVKKMIAILRSAAAKVKKDPTAVGDDSITDGADAIATELGMSVCGQG